MRRAVFTVIAKNYLAHARVLMESIRALHPELARFAILADRVDGCFDPGREPFTVIPSGELDIPDSRWFHFKYNLIELATAVKPYACERLFDDFDEIVYFDPDIRLYRRIDPVFDRLEGNSIVLTPHLTAPIEDHLHPGDLDILRSGAYNLGFLALARNSGTRRFVKWWQERVHDQCVVDVSRGLFVDQRWIDLAPGMFEGVYIARDPGFNAAYWNLHSRRIERIEGEWRSNDEPLYFFHFSGFDPRDPEQFSKHQNRFRLSTVDAPVRELAREYCASLLERGFDEARAWPYAYSRFENGTPIPDAGRRLVERPNSDPFSDWACAAFLRMCTRPEHGIDALPRLARSVYESRPDVQKAFPDPAGRDRARFLIWILTCGAKEHQLADPYLAPLRAEWRRHLASTANPWERAWYRGLLHGKSWLAGVPHALPPEPEVMLLGHIDAQTGVGESVRSAARAAEAAGISCELAPLDSAGGRVKILHANADEFRAVKPARGGYNIGYWAWELEQFPERWLPAFGAYREIWTPSSFCRESIARHAPVPVFTVPHCVEFEPPAASRERYGIARDAFVFLVMFDMLSVFDRKNPLAAVEAFIRAFAGAPGVELAIKVNHAGREVRDMELLRERCAGYPIRILDRILSREDTYALMDACDCLVSLHRSEGFGLAIAEAMYLGKPVIATAYSGNMDFTNASNAFLVDYRMKPVGKGNDPYPEDAVWADPSPDCAARHMRTVYESPEARERAGRNAKEFVQRELSPRAVGERMAERLAAIRETHR